MEDPPVTRAEKATAIATIAVALAVILIAVDVLTGQALSRRVSGRVTDAEIRTFMEAADARQ